MLPSRGLQVYRKPAVYIKICGAASAKISSRLILKCASHDIDLFDTLTYSLFLCHTQFSKEDADARHAIAKVSQFALKFCIPNPDQIGMTTTSLVTLSLHETVCLLHFSELKVKCTKSGRTRKST
jgi:hypothetical protein